MNIGINTNDDDLCIADNATTHTILKSNKFFSCLLMREVNVSTISGTTNIIEGSRRTIVLLPRGTRLDIKNSLLKIQYKLIKFQGYSSKWMSY